MKLKKSKMFTSGMKTIAMKSAAVLTAMAIFMSTAMPSAYATSSTPTQGEQSTSVVVQTGEPDATTAPAATNAPDATTAPAATNAPDATTAPAATNAPDATTAPAATNAPDATTAPATTNAPEMAVATAATLGLDAGAPVVDTVYEVEFLAGKTSVLTISTSVKTFAELEELAKTEFAKSENSDINKDGIADGVPTIFKVGYSEPSDEATLESLANSDLKLSVSIGYLPVSSIDTTDPTYTKTELTSRNGIFEYTYEYDYKGQQIFNYEITLYDPSVSVVTSKPNHVESGFTSKGTYTVKNPNGGGVQVGVVMSDDSQASPTLISVKPTEDQIPEPPADIPLFKSAKFDGSKFTMVVGPDSAENMQIIARSYIVVEGKYKLSEEFQVPVSKAEDGQWKAEFAYTGNAPAVQFVLTVDGKTDDLVYSTHYMRYANYFDTDGTQLGTQAGTNVQFALDLLPTESEYLAIKNMSALPEGTYFSGWVRMLSNFYYEVPASDLINNFEYVAYLQYDVHFDVNANGVVDTVNSTGRSELQQTGISGADLAKVASSVIPKLPTNTDTTQWVWEDEAGNQYTEAEIASFNYTSAMTFKAVEIEKPEIEVFEVQKVFDNTDLVVTNNEIREHFKANYDTSAFEDAWGIAVQSITDTGISYGDDTFTYQVKDVKWYDEANRTTNQAIESEIAPYTLTYKVLLADGTTLKNEDGEDLVGTVEMTVYPRTIHATAGSYTMVKGSNFPITQSAYDGFGYHLWQVSGIWNGVHVGSLGYLNWQAANNPIVNGDTPFYELSGYQEANNYGVQSSPRLAHDEIKVVHPDMVDGTVDYYQLPADIQGTYGEFVYPTSIDLSNYVVYENSNNYTVLSVNNYSDSKVFDNSGFTVESDSFINEVADVDGLNEFIKNSGYEGTYRYTLRFWNEETQKYENTTHTTSAAVGTYEVPFKLFVEENVGGEWTILSEEEVAADFSAETFANIEEVLTKTNAYLATFTITPVETEPTPVEPGPGPTDPPVIPLPILPEVEDDETPETEIEEPDVPFGPGEDEVEIEDAEVPLASGAAWALVNLILTIITGIISVMLLVSYFKNKDDEEWEEEDAKRKRKGGYRILSVIMAIVAVITFILTEDMTQPMILIDKWTLLMAVYAVIQLFVARLSRKEVEIDEENEANA